MAPPSVFWRRVVDIYTCRCIVGAKTRVELEHVIAIFMQDAALWRAHIATHTDANDAQLTVQRLFEDNALHLHDGPLDEQLIKTLLAIGVTERVRRATRQHLKLVMWDALGAATHDRHVNHDGTKHAFDDGDFTASTTFTDTDEMSLYYIAGYAGRCATVAFPTINSAALASSSSAEYHVFTAIYGNEALLRVAPVAHKIVSSCHGGQMCFVPIDCFRNLLMPIAHYVFSVPLRTLSDAAQLRATLRSRDFHRRFEQSVVQYGVNCFGARMKDKPFLTVYWRIFKCFVSRFALSVAKVRSDRILDRVQDQNAIVLESTLSGRLHKDASLHNALNLVKSQR